MHGGALAQYFDPDIEINLARAYDALSRTAEAEAQFKRAIVDGPSYSPAYSAYSQWLLSRGAIAEGLDGPGKPSKGWILSISSPTVASWK